MDKEVKNLLDMSNEAYHKDTQRISASGLKYIHRSPAHYYANFLDPNRVEKPPTPAMLLGTYTHCAILEPERFNSKYVCVDDAEIIAKLLAGGAKSPRATNEYKQWLEDFKKANADKELIGYDDFHTALAMRDAVWAMPKAAALLTGIIAEKTIRFDDADSGAQCKCRPDGIAYINEQPVILEIKTCENASPSAFGRQVANYQYHNQAAFYVDGYNAISEVKNTLHVFLAIEKEAPYACALYYTPDDVLALGRSENAADLRTYVECLRSGKWFGYDEDITPLQFPAWAFKQSELDAINRNSNN